MWTARTERFSSGDGEMTQESGRAVRTGERAEGLLQPGQGLIVTRWIALTGTARIARVYETELKQRFPASLVDAAKRFADGGYLPGGAKCFVDDNCLPGGARCFADDNCLPGGARCFADDNCLPGEARIAARFDACVLGLAEGGILGALWKAAEQAGAGLEVDLRRIPIRQETVEICEYFDVNPYYLDSTGASLIGTDQAGALAAALIEGGIPAAVIGRVTAGRKRLIRNGENISYLNRPQPDEWERRFGPK